MTAKELDDLARCKACGRHTWQEMAEHFGSTWNSVRNQWRRKARKRKAAPGPCPICGGQASRSAGEPVATEQQTIWEERGNYAEGSALVRSLDELLAILQPDANTWQLVDWGSKCWSIGANVKTGALTWEDGKIVAGHLDYKGIGKEDLWSTWARFVRRAPIPIRPTIQPISCPACAELPAPAPTCACTGEVGRALLLPDIHVGYARDLRTGQMTPFHDRRAMDIAVQVLTGSAWDAVVLLGDLLDMTTFTDKFVRAPEFLFTIQPAILEAHWYLHRLRAAAPRARIVYVEGNHEARMQKILYTHLMEACDLRAADELELPPSMSVPRLLALHELGIEWFGGYPDAQAWVGPLRLCHGDRVSATPGGSARAVGADGDQHTAFGHIHRIETVSRRVQERAGWRTVRTFSPGCLCYTDGRVPGSTAKANWQQGIGIVEYTAGNYTPHAAEIVDGECIYDGKVWRGADFGSRLREIWPDWRW